MIISLLLLQTTERIGSPALGIILPGIIMIISLILTWMLYKKFSDKDDK